MSATITELLKHRIVQAALAIVALIAAGSITYYLVESREPALAYVPAGQGTVAQTVTATGIVSPIQNPTLTFTSGGRVTYVNATVGQKVGAGAVLASLDTGVLSAQRAAAQAQLDKLVAGPRQIDLAEKQTAVASAQNSLTAAQQALPAAINSARGVLGSAIAATDPLFVNPNSGPTIQSLYEGDNYRRTQINHERDSINDELDELPRTHVTATSTASDLDASAGQTLNALQDADTLLSDLSYSLANAQTNYAVSGSQISVMATAVNSARSSVDAAITALTNARQNASASVLSVQSAQDQLSLAQAPARSEDVRAAEAQIATIDAQIRQAEVVAPFSGTIASVNVKVGDVLAPNSDAISLIPNGTSEVDVYLTEREVALLLPGDKADVTLDAFGSGQIFPATVSTIDRAPQTGTNGTNQGYKTVLVFTDPNPSIGIGMHANATIHGRTKQNVLTVPETSVITDGTKTYVLKKTNAGVLKTEVTLGLMGTDTVEVLSGLVAGDMVARVGSSNQ